MTEREAHIADLSHGVGAEGEWQDGYYRSKPDYGRNVN